MNNILQIKSDNNKKVAEYSVKNKLFDVGVSRYYYSVYLLISQYIKVHTTSLERRKIITHYDRFDKLQNMINDNRIFGVINNLNKMRKSRNISEYSPDKIISNIDSFNYCFFDIYKKVISILKELEVCDV